jgi:hypothetical protein
VRVSSAVTGLLGLLALAVSAQGQAVTSPDFTRADLTGLVFAPSAAPPGTHFVRGGSGPRILELVCEALARG